jgi:broad specificity phosphatase PhoE
LPSSAATIVTEALRAEYIGDVLAVASESSSRASRALRCAASGVRRALAEVAKTDIASLTAFEIGSSGWAAPGTSFPSPPPRLAG